MRPCATPPSAGEQYAPSPPLGPCAKPSIGLATGIGEAQPVLMPVPIAAETDGEGARAELITLGEAAAIGGSGITAGPAPLGDDSRTPPTPMSVSIDRKAAPFSKK